MRWSTPPGVAYAQGYRTDEDTVDPALEQAAVAAAASQTPQKNYRPRSAAWAVIFLWGLRCGSGHGGLFQRRINGILVGAVALCIGHTGGRAPAHS